jgi:Flp pilus assembly protein TadG
LSHHRSFSAFLWRRSRKERGQGIAEFALIWPIFVVCVMALLEFGVAFNNLLTINYASRNAALLGAEAGNNQCADVIILTSVERDVTAPAQPNKIASVNIYYSDDNGVQIPDPASGGHNGTDLWTRTGSTLCTFQATTYTVPYTLTAANTGYPYYDRCNQINGCGTTPIASPGSGNGHARLDTIGVKITYNYNFITPLSSAITLLQGTGNFNGGAWTFVQSQQMRMEPIL